MQRSLDAAYFARMYAASADPWDFARSPYENAKYRATVAALGGRTFRSGLEIGCSVGVLTALLAPLCERLTAIDVNARALEAARERCARYEHVHFMQLSFPAAAPAELFDFILLSEVAYYWSGADLARAIDWVAAAASGGTLELVHYLPKVDDYLRDGDAVHAAFLRDSRFSRLFAGRAEHYRIDVLRVR